MGGGSEHVLVKQPLSSQFLELPEGVSSALPGSIHRGICYPKGFVAGATACGLKASGRGDLGVCVVAPEWRGKAASSVVTTRNSFAAAPILLTRDGSARHLVGVATIHGNPNKMAGRPVSREQYGSGCKRVARSDYGRGCLSSPLRGDYAHTQVSSSAGLETTCCRSSYESLWIADPSVNRTRQG